MHTFRHALLGAAAISATLAAAPAWAQTKSFDVPAQPAASGVAALARQADVQILISATDARGRSVNAVRGAYPVSEAIERLLAGTGLSARLTGPQTWVVTAAGNAQVAPASTTQVEEVVVTGTRIRGMAPESSPVQVFDRADLEASGATTTEQFIRQLPQNFGGGSTEFSSARGVPNDVNSASNLGDGTGANLRGLGSRGTLTLLDGHRLAPSSFIGDFVDLSMIPASAIQRVEVLTDGASALYGADAVAGVMNFMLRKDFDGSETAVRYGNDSRGAYPEYRFSQTLGKSWSSGNVLAAYELYDRDHLALADRPFLPGFPAGGLTREQAREWLDLTPSQHRQSGVIVANQSLTPRLRIGFSGLYSDRKSDRQYYQSSNSTAYRQTNAADSKTLSTNLGLTYDLTSSWNVKFDTSYSAVDYRSDYRYFTTASPTPILYDMSSKLLSFDMQASGDLIGVFGGMAKAAIGTHFRREDFFAQSGSSGKAPSIFADGAREVSAIFGELLIPLVGPQNALPGVKRLDLNIASRREDYSDFGSSTNAKVGVLWSPIDGVKLRGSYGTSFAPPALGRAFDQGAAASVSGYAGIMRALGQTPLPALASVNSLAIGGTDPNLKPETSSTLTIGTDYERRSEASFWKTSITYYAIDFRNRLGRTPIPGNIHYIAAANLAYTNPDLFPTGVFIFNPTTDQIASAMSAVHQPVSYYFGASSLSNIGIVNTALVVRNLASVATSGLDISSKYSREFAIGEVTVGLNLNYILKFDQQAASTTAKVSTLNTLYNPVDLQLRGNLGWRKGGLSANLFVNYIDAYRVTDAADSAKIDSWTTADLSLSYRIPDASPVWLRGVAVNLSVTNALNEKPPAVPADAGYRLPGLDPTNATPLGRLFAVELRKTF
ncbi:TonB-dependent receptor [Brevundimonas sp. SORGH_AS_0993]|uniref:TonB-dependent receptor n=1 Tax=Brevundimonas sp. SORGH_AS_0993 TaxID=3041794 RepID=UPI0027883E79|nr:TonB-dependent receptor [Brevundimonas sp. SORGH_AS_0993]MDQ1153419.1 iron complex outermembrane receptor protein [Brevundimonas sp. SORGH_AS_0993]